MTTEILVFLQAGLIGFFVVAGISFLFFAELKVTVKQACCVKSRPTCNICSTPYTETGIHTPRIIKECGHSVCEQCADNLLKSKGENFVVCPFCQKATIVNGPAGILPKNFALLEQMSEMQQDPIRIV